MLQSNLDVSKELVLRLIENHKTGDIIRYQKLQRYYEGKSAILDRVMDEGKPNNRIVANYAGYIVDMIQGYMIGKPVSYSSENKELMEKVQDILNYNDEADENSELAKIMGIKGKSYELMYLDEEGNIRFNELTPDECMLVYNTAVNPEPIFAIRYYKIKNILNDTDEEYADVYTADEIITYKRAEKEFTEGEREPHYFGMVPIIEYRNNNEELGDFEKVLTLIDAYDIATSNKLNDLDYFSDAYMYIVGMSGTTPEDIANIRNARMMLLDENGQAGFLTKPSNDSEAENIKDRINSDIHKFSGIPDISDESFVGNASGVAMGYKLFALKQIVTNKERKFATGLRKRLELICSYLNLKGGNYDYRDITINFARNEPVNELEAVEIANALKGIVSNRTAIAYLPMVEDVQKELDQIESERSAYDIDNIEGGSDEDM